MKDIDFKVSVRCMTYNQAAYIEDAMNGFCMQQTDFPFVCNVMDDASNDGEQEVIRKYLESHFDLDEKNLINKEETDDYKLIFARHKENKNCYFAVFFLKYNHYGSIELKYKKLTYYSGWESQVEYVALCEGDDFWLDSMKLQKQVEFLEVNPTCSLICNRTKRYSERKKRFVSDNCCYEHSQYMNPVDIIEKGGLFISTCSIVYRTSIESNYPSYCINCHVGDYPLAIMSAMKGDVFYMNDCLSVYRVDNDTSWIGLQKHSLLSERRLKGVLSEIRMLQGFQQDYSRYSSAFQKRIVSFIISNMPNRVKDPNGYRCFVKAFCDEISSLNTMNKIMLKFLPLKYFRTNIKYWILKPLKRFLVITNPVTK